MAVKAGKVVTLGNGFLIERAQTVGAGNLNIPTERIQETGNEQSVSTERDVPDLSFDIESLDATIDTEAMICNIDPATLADGDIITFDMAQPLDVVSPWKAAGASKVSNGGIIWPHLTLASASYRFGVGTQGASQTFSFSGDSQYSSEQTPYREEYTGAGAGPYEFANTAVETIEEGEELFALGVTVYYVDGTFKRLFHGIDFTDDEDEVTLLDPAIAPGSATVAIVYFSAVTATFAQTIHSTPSVKPGKVKGKNIHLYVAIGPERTFNAATTSGDATVTATGGGFTLADEGAAFSAPGVPAGTTILTYTSATEVELSANATATAPSVVATLNPELLRWDGVQQVELNWRVTLDNDDELGNAHHVSSDYDIPELSGSITLRPASNARLFKKIEQVTGTPAGKVANVLSATSLEMQVRLQNPRTGAFIKTFRVADAQILPPGAQARAGQKTEPQMQWSSDSGQLEVIKGLPAAA